MKYKHISEEIPTHHRDADWLIRFLQKLKNESDIVLSNSDKTVSSCDPIRK